MNYINNNKLTKENYPEFSEAEYKMAFLDTFPTCADQEVDEVNTKVWGLLTNTQRQNIEELFTGKSEKVVNETKKDVLKIIKLRDSLNGKRRLYETSVKSIIEKQSKNAGLAFEYFLWDYLERNNNNPNISFEKTGYHLDQNYCTDLVINIKQANGEKVNIGIDFTLNNNPEIRSKKISKIKKTNSQIAKHGVKDYSSVRSPDTTGIMFIDKDQIKFGSQELYKAVCEFYKSKDQSGGPSKHLESGLQERFNNLSELLLKIFDRIRNKNYETFTFGNNSEYSISFQQNGNRLSIIAGLKTKKTKKKRSKTEKKIELFFDLP